MNLSDVAIRRPVFTTMLSMVAIVLGLLSLSRLGTELYPPVNFPFLTVLTVYPGAGPEDIERDVVRPMEDAVAGISGLSDIRSYTRMNSTFTLLKFDMGTNVDVATNAVRDRLGAVEGQLPAGAEKPVLRQIDIGALPVMVAAITTDRGVNLTRSVVDDRLRPALEQVSGVGAVNVIGGQDREIQVNLDLDALAALGLPPSAVTQRLGADNLSMPLGEIRSGAYAIGVRTDGQFASKDDLANAVIFQTQSGTQVRLKDVATVVDTNATATRYVRNNLSEAVSIEVVKKSGSNTVAVCDEVRKKLTELVPTLGPGAAWSLISDQSTEINANADEVWIAIYFGGAMAILVILFFLLDVRGTIISALALPTSIIGTFAAMGALGFSINTMTLLGLSLAIGLLIDDAVVVRESITRRLEAGDSPEVAASRGTSEIALAVMATTLSLVAVFVPVAFMSGIVGQFFKQFGLTIAVAVLLSLFVAFTLDPMLSSRFARAHDPHAVEPALVRKIRAGLDRVDDFYRRVLEWVIRHPGTTVGMALLALGLAGVTLALLPQEFMPKQDRGEILADLRLPMGTALESTNLTAYDVEKELVALPEIRRVYTIIGHEDQTNRARFRVQVAPKEQRSHPLSWYQDQVRATLSKVPRAEVTLTEPAVIEGLGDFPPLMLILQGPELDGVLAEGRRVRDILKSQSGTSDVRLTVDAGRPELVAHIDRGAAADRGIPTALIGATARMLVDGEIVGSLRDGGDEADIRVRAASRFAEDPEAIAALPLPSQRGAVRLGDVATIQMQAGPSTIEHYNRMRSVTVSTQIANGAALGDVVKGFNDALKAAPLKEGYLITVDGQAKDMKDTIAAMGLAVGVAGVFIYMVLASQFESFVHPFTLLVSIPLALVGAVGGLAITGKSLSMGSLIGLILLMGLVTKNAILLVDGTLAAMRDGAGPADALRLAGPRRLRPILMTSAAMVLGMMPTALGTGTGSEFRAPMAIAVIGGVISSTLLTLLVVPVIFLFVERILGRLRALPPQAE